MKIKRHLLLSFLITATIALFLPFATLTFHVGELYLRFPLSLLRLFGLEELGQIRGLQEIVVNTLFLPLVAYVGGALLVLLSLMLAWTKKGEHYLIGNFIGALTLFSYVRKVLNGLPLLVDDYLTDHFGVFSVLFDLEHALIVAPGVGGRLLFLSLYHLVGFWVLGWLRYLIGKQSG